jgi:hypothetical protein
VGVRAVLELGVPQGEPFRLARDRLVGTQQSEDRFERLLHHRALVDGIDPHHVGVGGQRAGSGPEDRTSMGEVVEQHHPIGDHQRVVVRQ